MESWVFSQCGLRPLPSVVYRPKARLLPNPKLLNMTLSVPGSTRTHLGRPIFTLGSTLRDWGLRVSTPARVVSLEEEDMSSRSADDCTTSTGLGEAVAGDGDFDPGMPPPFGLADVRAAIPKHCWVKDPVRSMSYVVQDVGIVLALAAAAAYINSWIVWPLYWVAQGTMFWALFSLGHDCGHGSFSDNPKLNSVAGHFLHTSILIPYHGWRISHRTHHQNIGHVEKDESWHPLPETAYRGLDLMTRKFWFTPPLPLIVFPFYLWGGTPGNRGSHYDPNSNMFVPSERKDVILSTSWWAAMVALLAGLSWVMGPIKMLNLYGIPYWISMMWLAFVTYLHHHGHDDKLPWYRGKDWSYLRGGLTTIDRDYGLFNSIHHDINTHVIHHLFPQIPHYHLVEATEAARPVLGKYYREPKKSGPFPFHLFGDLVRSLRSDHYVSDTGGVVYYQTDPELTGSSDKSE